MNNVYLVEDDSIFSAWLFATLSNAPGLSIFQFRSGVDFIDNIQSLEAGVVLMDLRMPGLSGLDTFEHYRNRRDSFPTILISGDGDIQSAVSAMRMGAVNFLLKPFGPNDLFGAIDDCLRHLQSAQAVSRSQSAQVERIAKLTARESEIFRLLVQGMVNRQIAEHLQLSVRTVETYRAKLMAKLGVANLPEAISLACTVGFIDLAEVGVAARA